jgi:N-acetylglucosaminyltransferase
MSQLAIWLPLVLGSVIAAAVCLHRSVLVRRYRPVESDYAAPTSVVCPSFREDPQILELSVRSWLRSGVDELLLVIPAEDANVVHARRLFASDPRVQILVAPTTAKRPNVARGVRAATKPIVVLADSDTVWAPDLLPNLVRPFGDPRVGGVAVRPRALAPESSVWRRIADWLFDAKYLRQVPAMASAGSVSCLSGRTVAYRRNALLDVLPGLVDETFAGTTCVSGDDGRLTWLVLQRGYRTVYQRNAVAWTMAPETMRGFVMQRLRFARNDYRNYLRAFSEGWLRRQPLATRIFVLQVLVGPMWSLAALAFSAVAVASGRFVAAGLWAAASLWGQGVIVPERLRREPRNILYLPLVAVVTVLAVTLIKLYAACTLRKQAWLTRRRDVPVPEGQSARSLGWSLEHRARPLPVQVRTMRTGRR